MPAYIDYYKILGLDRDAGPEKIKQAYRSMAKKFHPDINDAPDAHERFIEITEAYDILMNRDLKRVRLSTWSNLLQHVARCSNTSTPAQSQPQNR